MWSSHWVETGIKRGLIIYNLEFRIFLRGHTGFGSGITRMMVAITHGCTAKPGSGRGDEAQLLNFIDMPFQKKFLRLTSLSLIISSTGFGGIYE